MAIKAHLRNRNWLVLLVIGATIVMVGCIGSRAAAFPSPTATQTLAIQSEATIPSTTLPTHSVSDNTILETPLPTSEPSHSFSTVEPAPSITVHNVANATQTIIPTPTIQSEVTITSIVLPTQEVSGGAILETRSPSLACYPTPVNTHSTPTAHNQELSTPALLAQALDNGEITAEQRLLYLAYATGDYDKLPPQFRGNVPWRGTLTLLELGEVITSPSLMCSLSRCVQDELRRIFKSGVTCDK